MLNENDLYVVFKLHSGETVMAVLRQEDDNRVLVEHPMVMKSILNIEAGKEHLTAMPLCAFTDESEFILPKSSIMFMKKLHRIFIPHYQRIVQDHERTTTFIPPDQPDGEPIGWDDVDEEKAKELLQKLKSVVESEEETDLRDKLARMVPGNDTIN